MRGLNSPSSRDRVGWLAGLIREVRLCWRLLRDPRVPMWTKSIPLLSLLYLLFPLDLIWDPALGLGQLDDLALLVFGMELFINLSPPQVVAEIRQALEAGRGKARPPTVDADYRIVDDQAPKGGAG